MESKKETYSDYKALIKRRFSETASFRKLVERLSQENDGRITISGLAGSSAALLVANLIDETSRLILAVTNEVEEANNLFDDLNFLLGEKDVVLFPPRMIPPYEFRTPTAEIIGQRLYALSRLVKGETKILVASLEALMEPTVARKDFERGSLMLKVDQEMEIDRLAEKLIEMGFQRVPLVEEVGDFALRGGLIDFFSPGFEGPIRLEFYGDIIETIREFDVASQRTTGKLEEVTLLPKREVPITFKTLESYLSRLNEKDGDFIRARYLNDPELPGLEWLAIPFGLEYGSLMDYLNKDRIIVIANDVASLEATADEIKKTGERHRERIRERLDGAPPVENYYGNAIRFFSYRDQVPGIKILPFGNRDSAIDFHCREHPAIGSRLDLLADTIENFRKEQVKFFIATDNAGQASRLGELLSEKIPQAGPIPIEVALLKGGFVSRENRLAILTDHQIFGKYYRRTRRKKFREGVALQSYTSLVNGDFVVHEDFGIARYAGLKTIQIDGKERDCLHLIYAEGGKLYVPIEEFNRVGKYAGKDAAPKLSVLGGTGWDKIKARTKKAIADMAADLIKIYAERKTRPGFGFGPDTTWMKQLEASFIYDETPDQLKAIEVIKTDMQKVTPMDRLICGDVGYGKTEVAVRAAFKAVEAGKQVAVLVPTTILAQQHLNTFSQRLADFPVRVEMLSRFRNRKEQLEIVRKLGEGKVDVVIGTHRLLSKDVKFADLGLLVIDEEQRFGVKHKESLRKLRATVDTIAMTATPIPRTLQMSLMGARDMSLINTSPKDRLPIITEISEFEPEVISEAILREIDRGGQVFFVHNRVQTIESMYRYLKKIVPQVEIAVAHGQMHERSLEGIMLAFLSGRFQVLLSTSIIESGLDIPSVNTIIINRADRFGLAQLYQLRGRVGRSSVRAYAYLLTPPYRLLSEDARKRLRAIEAHADLGSGFALAMKDLEIRGAGNILGAEQSGFIEEVGFDLYTKLLEQAVAELKGETVVSAPDTRLESDIDMSIPDFYININQQKVEIYQKIAGARTLQEIENIRDDVEDRYGHLPEETANLFEAAAVRISAWAQEIEKVRLRGGRVELQFKGGRKFDRKGIEGWRRAVEFPMEFSLGGNPTIKIELGQTPKRQHLAYLRAVLNRI
ncbi:Transcription-repair-coupling factor [Candidatus Zixiibacteriota bacterium]|nr:Transcription-repair-coupling factor [candidate division Zixibacteria bacterium]